MPTSIPNDASPQLIKLLRVIKVLLILQLVPPTQLLACVVLVADLWMGLMNLLAALALVMILCTKNWCMCICFVLLALSNTLSCIVLVGTYFAERHSLSNWRGIVLFVSLLQVPFYVVALHYTFESYKELKCER